MSRYPLGQPVRIPVTVQQLNTDGTYSLVDSVPTIVVKLAAADGTLTVTGTYSSPAHDSLGKYHQDVPSSDLATIGHYQWAATTTGTGAGVGVGDFDVFDPFELSGAPFPAGAQPYCTAEELKQRLRITGAADDDQIDIAVVTASQAINDVTERYFWKATDTRTYVPADLYHCYTDDLVSVTTLATDPGGTTPQGGTFPVTWAASDFQLLPYNPGKTGEPYPYTSIRAVGHLTFPWVIPLILMRMDRVQVTGVFGWPAVPRPIKSATLIAAAELFRMKDTPLGGAAPGEFAVAIVQSNPMIGKLIYPYSRNPVLMA